MSRDIWIISDTHFNHANILKFTNWTGVRTRPEFDNVNQMNECMIENWNSVIKHGDIVYHLGDVVMGLGPDREAWMSKNWPKLHGRKRLVVGNHDDIKSLSSGGWFQKVTLWRPFPEFGLILTHVPLHPNGMVRPKVEGTDELMDKQNPDLWITVKNVHGHIHNNPSPDENYFNASVENINYTPINIEELRIM